LEFLRLLAVLAGYGRVLRHARAEIDYWELRATGALAWQKMRRERRNVESATFFSMLSPPRERLPAMRRIVRFQLAYELLDGLSEEASSVAESLRLHDALHVAVRSSGRKYNTGFITPPHGYLAQLVAACRTVSATPSTSMGAAINRIARAQALNHAGLSGAATAWWESAAAEISSLDVLAMLTTPTDQHRAILDAYPEVCAVSALLDALVDLPDDQRTGNHNWLMHYESMDHASWRLAELAEVADARLGDLEQPLVHRAALAGLLAHNLVRAPEPFRRRLAPMVPYTRSAMALFGARRMLPD
jgi:hypothetical protein